MCFMLPSGILQLQHMWSIPDVDLSLERSASMHQYSVANHRPNTGVVFDVVVGEHDHQCSSMVLLHPRVK
jgi:hypothetical protein